MPNYSNAAELDKKLEIFEQKFIEYFNGMLKQDQRVASGQAAVKISYSWCGQLLAPFVTAAYIAGIPAILRVLKLAPFFTPSSALHIPEAIGTRFALSQANRMQDSWITGQWAQQEEDAITFQNDHIHKLGLNKIQKIIRETAREICRVFEEQIDLLAMPSGNPQEIESFAYFLAAKIHKFIIDTARQQKKFVFDSTSFLEALIESGDTKLGTFCISVLEARKVRINLFSPPNSEEPLPKRNINDLLREAGLRREVDNGKYEYRVSRGESIKIKEHRFRGPIFRWNDNTKSFQPIDSDTASTDIYPEIIKANHPLKGTPHYSPRKRLAIREDIKVFTEITALEEQRMDNFCQFFASRHNCTGKTIVFKDAWFPPGSLLENARRENQTIEWNIESIPLARSRSDTPASNVSEITDDATTDNDSPLSSRRSSRFSSRFSERPSTQSHTFSPIKDLSEPFSFSEAVSPTSPKIMQPVPLSSKSIEETQGVSSSSMDIVQPLPLSKLIEEIQEKLKNIEEEKQEYYDQIIALETLDEGFKKGPTEHQATLIKLGIKLENIESVKAELETQLERLTARQITLELQLRKMQKQQKQEETKENSERQQTPCSMLVGLKIESSVFSPKRKRDPAEAEEKNDIIAVRTL